MAGQLLRLCLSLIAAIGAVRCAQAQYREATPAEQRFADMEARYAPTPAAFQPAPSEVQQTAFVQPTGPPSGPTLPSPASAAPPVAPHDGSNYPVAPNDHDVVLPPPSDAWCMPPQPPCRTSSWTIATEIIPVQSDVVRPDFGSWSDDHALAMRVIAAYEDPRGLGVRGRFWGLGQEVEAYSEDVDLRAAALDLDLYKRFFVDDSEIVLGGGASTRGLEFKQAGNGYSKYSGGGLSMFVEGFVPLLEFPKSVIGQAGRARVTLTTGNWNDTTDQGPNGIPGPENIVPGTDHDSMNVVEFGWGLEYRRRFGELEDHSWYFAVMLEHQNWQSGWMTNFLGSSVSFTGVNVGTGLSW